jgi:hypothetical protein
MGHSIQKIVIMCLLLFCPFVHAAGEPAKKSKTKKSDWARSFLSLFTCAAQPELTQKQLDNKLHTECSYCKIPDPYAIKMREIHEAFYWGPGKKEVVHNLLQNRANVNAVSTSRGLTPLHRVAQTNNVELAQILINHKADVTAKKAISGNTPLHYTWDQNIAQILLDNKADMYARDTYGFNCLQYMAYWGHNSVLWLCIQRGASTRIKNNMLVSPLSFPLLLAYGASSRSDQWQKSFEKKIIDLFEDPDLSNIPSVDPETPEYELCCTRKDLKKYWPNILSYKAALQSHIAPHVDVKPLQAIIMGYTGMDLNFRIYQHLKQEEVAQRLRTTQVNPARILEDEEKSHSKSTIPPFKKKPAT